MNNALSVPNSIQLPSAYTGFNEQELLEKLNPKQFKFAAEYINNGYNAVKAWLKTYYTNWETIKAGSKQYRNASAAVAHALNKSPLAAYIYRVLERTTRYKNLKAAYSYEQWFDDSIRIRDAAIEAGQYGPAIAAHKLIGTAQAMLTPTDRQAVANKSNGDILDRLALVNPAAAKALAPALGVKRKPALVSLPGNQVAGDPLDGLI